MMTTRQTVFAMRDIEGEIMAPNYRRDDEAELEARGLMEFRQGCWHITSEGRRFLRNHGEHSDVH